MDLYLRDETGGRAGAGVTLPNSGIEERRASEARPGNCCRSEAQIFIGTLFIMFAVGMTRETEPGLLLGGFVGLMDPWVDSEGVRGCF